MKFICSSSSSAFISIIIIWELAQFARHSVMCIKSHVRSYVQCTNVYFVHFSYCCFTLSLCLSISLSVEREKYHIIYFIVENHFLLRMLITSLVYIFVRSFCKKHILYTTSHYFISILSGYVPLTIYTYGVVVVYITTMQYDDKRQYAIE